jgi:hypothetical protein
MRPGGFGLWPQNFLRQGRRSRFAAIADIAYHGAQPASGGSSLDWKSASSWIHLTQMTLRLCISPEIYLHV